ncbi:uncharacterized protein LOC124162397 [Ischnura elegans]|uniref:uncharacterized protein LOC124162397 n=1 Tax=Ischnura elegans TaxID=197161 RepID=UPI001ED89BF6|nr:uncharacterized protein LOC124162397 [Ischnura elegans]
MSFLIPWLLLTVLASCCVSSMANTDFIRLDMSPVRGPTPPHTKKYPIRAPPPAIPPEQKPDIFCTDGRSPDDFFCDMRRFYGSKQWKERSAPDVYDFDLDYPDPKRKGVSCTASFKKSNASAGSVLSLPFVSFSCSGGSGQDTAMPTLSMTSVKDVRVSVRRPDDIDFKCEFTFRKSGSTARSGRANGSGVVRFQYVTHYCLSPVVIDRQTTASSVPCEDNGRRCRPGK